MRNFPDVWRPLSGVSTLRRRMDQLFDDFLMPLEERRVFEGMELMPEAELDETASHYRVIMDLPGIDRKHINIEMRGNELVVSGERKEEHEEKDRLHHIRERKFGSFHRVFMLPNVADINKVEATFENGVLQILVPKSETARGRTIQISEKRKAA